MSHYSRAAVMRRTWALLFVLAVSLVAAARADAAELVGGPPQAAISRAFFAHGAHRGQVITSVRASTAAPAWSVVKSVAVPRGGHAVGRLRTTFVHRVGRGLRAGSPPAAARADLTAPFTVGVRYAGSGREAIRYRQVYASVCLGQGGFIDEQTTTVAPMSWSVRYVVAPDALQSVTRGSAGIAILPRITLDRAASSVRATEALHRSVVDAGCVGPTQIFNCSRTYGLGGAGQLGLLAGGGLEVGVPLRSRGVGDCEASDFTLGPSLWDGGGVTAVPRGLRLTGRLPVDPYRPRTVAWPAQAAGDGALTSPCQGISSVCSETFAWSGTVELQRAG